MSLSTAKHHAHLAKYSSTDDSDRVKHLTDAMYALVRAVEDLEKDIRRLRSDTR